MADGSSSTASGSRTKAATDEWVKELAPSDRLRRWFGHDPDRWGEFRRRYWEELRQHAEELRDLARRTAGKRVTLVYGAKDAELNNAIVLKAELERLPKGKGRR